MNSPSISRVRHQAGKVPGPEHEPGKRIIEGRKEWQPDDVVIVTMREEQVEIGVGRTFQRLTGGP